MTSASTNPTEVHRSLLRRHPLLWTALCALILSVPIIVVIDHYWPYRYRNVQPTLESVFASQIKINKYHRTYFPYPGFIADGITLRRNSAPNLPPVGSIQHVRVEGRWGDLFMLRRVIHRVLAEGLHIVIPPVGSAANRQDFPPGSANDFTGPTTAIQQLDIRDAQLDILRNNGGRYTFPIHRLLIGNLRQGSAITYSVDMQNARPSGHIQSSGSFGPLLEDQLGSTPVNGTFSFSQVALTELGNLHGTLSSFGHFQGTLASIEAAATSSVPNFAVSAAKPTAIAATSSCSVSALTGDISLHAVDVVTGHTTVHVHGSIAGSPKLTTLDLSTNRGRVEDLLRLFSATSPPVTGPIQLHSHAVLAPATEGATFLHRLNLTGVFDIPAQRLTDSTTEQSLSAFSQRAQGLSESGTPEANVLSSLDGAVNIREGVAHASHLRLQFPGAAVQVDGTFDLNSQTVNMQGNLSMHTDISHVTTGFKSYLLKPLAPFFKHKNAGAVIPIAITGTPKHYRISQNIFHLNPAPNPKPD